MNPESEEIEVEVVEVVDEPLSVERTREHEGFRSGQIPPRSGWSSQWQGRVRRLDMRWWPLWSVIALIVLIPLVLLALVVGICLVILKLVARVLALGKR